MTPIATATERDRAAARLDRLTGLHLHVVTIIGAVVHPGDDLLLRDAGRYVDAALDVFSGDLINELETLRQAIAAWDASREG